MLNALSKVLESVILEQLTDYAEEVGLLPACQHGFRRKRSCSTALTAALYKWHKLGKGAAIVSLDYSAAFDTLGVDVLIAKLRSPTRPPSTSSFPTLRGVGKLSTGTARGAPFWR